MGFLDIAFVLISLREATVANTIVKAIRLNGIKGVFTPNGV